MPLVPILLHETLGMETVMTLRDNGHHQDLSSVHPTYLVSELLKRHRGDASYEDLKNSTPEQILTALEVYLSHQSVPVRPSHGTTIACTKCDRKDAPAYYLKRSHGHYSVLCFDNGAGCWEHSAHGNCSFTDPHQAQCMNLAEWEVAYGPDKLRARRVCSEHVPSVLSDVSEHRIYPLQD